MGRKVLKLWASRLIRKKRILEREAVDSQTTLHVFSKKYLGATQECRGDDMRVIN